ncbi:hydroxymethylglutaryl-CoA reductase [Dendryphion nanum]|uniref:hydroxymethylglutaryl-CoA reductase (NADPH) n=1 Tax=Dendryphion nanum TaxID=256645 RepID=A0A9P9CWA4_9PLEO|nr:hydroxymethylglutaryl-CoA reductase [Dendryphion nanum]
MTSLQRTQKFASLFPLLSQTYSKLDESQKITIENFVGCVPVPVGLAGPLRIQGSEDTDFDFFAPLATVEPTLVASCSRGCKAFHRSGGMKFHEHGEGMSRAPIFFCSGPEEAVMFSEALPKLHDQLAKDAESTSKHVRLQTLTPHVIGSQVHVKFTYSCGDAVGQNMVTIATQKACDSFMSSEASKDLGITGFIIEGDFASDKKPSWGNVQEARGVRVTAWGRLSNDICEEVLGCSSLNLYLHVQHMKEGQVRNGQFGSSINTANVVAAIFIACGQDAGSVPEASWSQLTPEYDFKTKDLTLSMFFPSLPVGVVGGGTHYTAQNASLQMMKCQGPGMKKRLAGLVACFALALDLSTVAAIANGTFTQSHERLARGKVFERASM